MASAHSYTITIGNNKTESEGAKYLLRSDVRFIRPDTESRKRILKILKLPKSFLRAFDLVTVVGHTNRERKIVFDSTKDITLIELKTTKKKLDAHPKGFFFGATHNEYTLASKLGKKYRFAFVCLHPETKAYVLLTMEEVEKLTKTKRIQYQVNF